MTQTKTSTPVVSATTSLTENSIFIVEYINEGLAATKDSSNEIYLEGIAAKFGVKNNNNRIYEKEEYLPHLEYLNKKIQSGQLLGELDHPQNFDVSLKNVSHVIEGLYYDQNENDVRIKVRLLDTPLGRIAKTLVEAGCTVSISSRAAGQVLNEGRVKLHRIFTYDLVAEPGFSQAMLKRTINESINTEFNMITESLDKLKQTCFFSKLEDISESYNFGNSVKIYKSKETAPVENNTPKMSEFVTKTDFDKYSKTVKQRYDSLKESFQSLNVGKDGNVDVTKLAAYTNYLAEELMSSIKFSNYLAGLVENNIQYSEHVAETVNNVIDYSNYLGEKVTQNVKFSEYIGEKLNDNINYSNYLSGKVNEGINFSNYLAETLDKGIQYSEYVSEQVNSVIDYSDYLGEKLTLGIHYSQYVAENLDKNIAFANYIVEGLNEGGFSSQVAKKSNSQKLDESAQKINESVVIDINESSDIESIVNAVNAIAKKVESNTADAVLEQQYPFLKLMSKPNKEAFKNLDAAVKTDVVKVLGSSVWTNEAEIINIMTAVIEKRNENIPNYIKFIPESFKPMFEAMTEREKNALASQAYGFQLHTPYQVKNFWETRDLRGIKERIEKENIQHSVNEDQSKEGYLSLNQVAEHMRGYSRSYVDNFLRK